MKPEEWQALHLLEQEFAITRDPETADKIIEALREMRCDFDCDHCRED